MGSDKHRYNSYGQFLKERFGCKVYKISVDGGFSCPNRDGIIGTGGCAYCSNDSFRPETANRLKSISQQVKDGIDHLTNRYGAGKFLVYFQPYTNTYAPLDVLIPLYESALDHPDVIGLSVGTRPDCIDPEKIAWFEKLARNYFVTLEYGLQSIYDKTLANINRGHTYQCWVDAMEMTRNRGIWLCAHLILGFPWETREEMLASADALSGKGLNFLKLHHFHIVQNTPLANEYREKPFPLIGFEDYVELVADFIERLDPDISIERFFGFAPIGQLIGPVWSKSKSGIRYAIEQRLIARDTQQGQRFKN
jgi:radical SAM protein (TIGR01212 family)